MARWILAPLALSSCAALPDRFFTSVTTNPLDIGERYADEDRYALTFGTEWDLSPVPVVIEGQAAEHPWDLRSAVGLWGGPEDAQPVPLRVSDDRTVEALEAVTEALTSHTEALEADRMANERTATAMEEVVEALRSVKAQWYAVFGGGGLVAALAFFGIRRRKTQNTEA